MLEKLKAHDVKALSYGVIDFTKDHDKNKKQFDLAKSLNLQNLSCNPDPDAFDSLDKLTDEYNITCAIHPHGPGAKWVKIDQIHDAIKDHNKKIGLCCDTGHLIRADQDPLRALEVFKDRTYALHLKDFKKLGPDKWEDVPAGDAAPGRGRRRQVPPHQQVRGPRLHRVRRRQPRRLLPEVAHARQGGGAEGEGVERKSNHGVTEARRPTRLRRHRCQRE